MALPTRDTSTYTLPTLSTGSLLQENGDLLLTEDGFEILIEDPVQNPNLSSRNATSSTLPSRN